MINGPDERGIAAYVRRVIHRGPVNRRLFPWFKGTVTEVLTSGYSMMVRVKRSGEFRADGGTYAVAMPNYRPQVGDTVDLLWRDDDTAYAMAPRGGAGGFAPWGGWLHWSRYTVGAGGALDTSSNPGGDIPIPTGFKHAKVLWSAGDTSANTSASFGGMQVATSGGVIDAAAHYNWTDIANFNGGAPAGGGSTTDIAWKCFVTTGGGTGAVWMSHGEITLVDYANGGQALKALWDTLQVNNSTIGRRMGSGYYFGAVGVATKLHFFATAGLLAAGTTFDLLVMS